MAKKKEESVEVNEEKNNDPKPAIETKKPAEQKQGRLEVVNSESKFNLKTKSGRKVLWTLDEALMPHNFKQLSKRMQDCLTGKGKSTHVILRELNS